MTEPTGKHRAGRISSPLARPRSLLSALTRLSGASIASMGGCGDIGGARRASPPPRGRLFFPLSRASACPRRHWRAPPTSTANRQAATTSPRAPPVSHDVIARRRAVASDWRDRLAGSSLSNWARLPLTSPRRSLKQGGLGAFKLFRLAPCLGKRPGGKRPPYWASSGYFSVPLGFPKTRTQPQQPGTPARGGRWES